MRFTAGRNQIGLTERQIAYCVEAWAVLCADRPIAFDTSEAVQYASRTRFEEARNTVFLGADALPGDGADANARLSTLACLAHERKKSRLSGKGLARCLSRGSARFQPAG